MRLLTVLTTFLICVFSYAAYAEDKAQEVKVADPFLEVHTGPSVGYPIFHVIKRDETISIIKTRTEWYLIKNHKKLEGWVHRSQLVKTLTLEDEQIEIKDLSREDYLNNDLEISMIGGNFGNLPMMTLSGSYALTRNISTEVSFAQILGNFSSRRILGINLTQQPFPSWKVSPYFSLGTGISQLSVKPTISKLKDTTDFAANVSLGIKMYLTRRFFLRTDVKKHIIFQSKNKNEEITSWQVGFAVFF